MIIHVRVVIQENVEIQKMETLHIDPFVFDEFQFHVDQVKIPDLDIIIVIEKSVPIELHYVQEKLKHITD